jgi:hypothetical protein
VVLAPARSARHWYVAVRSASGSHGVVGDADGTGWVEQPLPAGSPVAIASTTEGVWLAAVSGGHSTLWRTAEDG